MTHHHEPNADAVTGQVRVFVSYRRADTKHVAGRLRDRIVARFGEDSVFVDVESIEPGLDYVTAIDQAVGSCDVMLVLIGEGWLPATDAQGRRRIDDPTDRLRLEVEAGLRKQTRVIPVLVDSASMPKAGELPTSLVPLARHHATRLSHESFQGDADHLLAVVERVVGDTDSSPPLAAKRDAVRWLSVGILLIVLLALVAMRSGVEDSVAASRRLPTDGPWGSLVWLLPVLPVLAAGLLVANGKRRGVALGCTAGAALWLLVSLVFVADTHQEAGISAHMLILALLIGGMASLFVAVREMREHVRPNPWDRVLIACLLAATAIVLRIQPDQIASVITSTTIPPTDWVEELGRPRFWIAVLIPALICLPGALLRCNRTQTQTLLAMAFLQTLYPLAMSSMRIITSDARTAAAVIDDLVFLVGSVCILLAVLEGQRRSVQHT